MAVVGGRSAHMGTEGHHPRCSFGDLKFVIQETFSE